MLGMKAVLIPLNHCSSRDEGLVGMNWDFGHLDRIMPLSVVRIFTFWKSTMAIGKSTVNGRFLAGKIIELGDFPANHVWLLEGTHQYFMNIPLVYHHMPWISSRFCEYPTVYRWFPVKASVRWILRDLGRIGALASGGVFGPGLGWSKKVAVATHMGLANGFGQWGIHWNSCFNRENHHRPMSFKGYPSLRHSDEIHIVLLSVKSQFCLTSNHCCAITILLAPRSLIFPRFPGSFGGRSLYRLNGIRAGGGHEVSGDLAWNLSQEDQEVGIVSTMGETLRI